MNGDRGTNVDRVTSMTLNIINGKQSPDSLKGSPLLLAAICDVIESGNLVETLGFRIGKFVRLSHSPEIGVIVGYNTSLGFLNGQRYPVNVKFCRGTFEYGIVLEYDLLSKYTLKDGNFEDFVAKNNLTVLLEIVDDDFAKTIMPIQQKLYSLDLDDLVKYAFESGYLEYNCLDPLLYEHIISFILSQLKFRIFHGNADDALEFYEMYEQLANNTSLNKQVFGFIQEKLTYATAQKSRST